MTRTAEPRMDSTQRCTRAAGGSIPRRLALSLALTLALTLALCGMALATQTGALRGARLGIASEDVDSIIQYLRTVPPNDNVVAADFPHFDLFRRENWGLIVYDEVHLLPAPVFRATARIQAVRRLGLTATLVREDGKEADVFGLIGPKRFDIPWKELEHYGWIAPAVCTEIRVGLHDDARMEYALADPQQRYRLAASTPRKTQVVQIGRAHV